MTETGLLLIAIFLCLLGNGFFSGSEIAVISARRSRIEAMISQGSRGAERVKALQNNMDHFLATAQIGVTLMGTLAGVIGGYQASQHIEPWLRGSLIGRWLPPAFEATFVVGVCIVYIELILGELVPKALALRFGETAAVLVAFPLTFMARISRWAIRLLTASTRAVLALGGISDMGRRTFVSGGEIKHLVRECQEQGGLGQTEAELIHGVFGFAQTPVKKVMVPRPKIFALDVATPPEQVGSLIVESGFSRIPAYDGSIDNVLGLVYVKDVLRLLDKRQPVVI